MKIDEFLSRISITSTTWNDYGYTQEAKITFKTEFDEKNFFVKIYPNTNENFERIKTNQLQNFEECFLWGQSQEYYKFISDTLDDDSDKNTWFELTGDIASQGEKFIKYYHNLESSIRDPDNDHTPQDYTLFSIFNNSFFRDQTEKKWRELLQTFHRMTVNKSFLSDYKFTIKKGNQELFTVDVSPNDNISIKPNDDSLPFSVSKNVFCIIGDNGSGKTHFIRELSKSILNDSSELSIENIEFDTQEDANMMNKILYCSFSPFDKKFSDDHKSVFYKNESFEYIGLLDYAIENKNIGDEITTDIMESLRSVKNNQNDKSLLWLDVMERVSFEKWIYNIISIFQNDLVRSDSVKTQDGETTSSYIYINEDETSEKIKNLSSGQKIFLLTITKLVLNLTERTILFVDEPELFLHPPMVKTYVRLISDLVSYVNGLGFIITHSPITIQEFPNDCVKVAYRDQLGEYSVKSIDFKTFGENISVVNDKIFNIGLQQSGYYDLIERLKYSEDGEKHLRKIYNFSGTEAKLLIGLFLKGKSK